MNYYYVIFLIRNFLFVKGKFVRIGHNLATIFVEYWFNISHLCFIGGEGKLS